MMKRGLESTHRRTMLLAACAVCATPMSAFAQTFPSKPIQLVIGYPPGSSADLTGRIFAKTFSDAIGAPIVVVNKPGASATVAAQSVITSPPDGYTLFYGLQDSNILAGLLRRNLPFDSDKDLVPLAKVVDFGLLMVVNASSTRFNSVADVIAAAKAQPDELKYSSSGIGGLHQLAVGLFMQRTGVRLSHVPFQGGGPALMGLLRGDVDLMMASEPLLMSQINAGKLRVLASLSETRSAQVPSAPTMAEAEVASLTVDSWYGIFAPAGISPDISRKLIEASKVALADPDYLRQIQMASGVVRPLYAEEFRQYINAQREMYRSVIQHNNIKIEEY